MLATIQYYEHDYAAAAQTLERLPENNRDPNDLLLEAYVQRKLGNGEGALEALTKAKELLADRIKENPDDPNLHGLLAMAYALGGEKKDALAAINRAAALAPPSQDAIDSANWLNALAAVHIENGDTDAALEELRKAVSLPNGPSYGELRLNPTWDPVRAEPQFQRILAEAATPPGYN